VAKETALLSVYDVALRLGLSEVWVRRLITEGRIEVIRRDGRVWVTEHALAKFAQARQARQLVAADDGAWATEAMVVDGVERYLKRQGWRRISRADPNIREHGIDLVMERESVRLGLEAKGYPARLHADGPKAGQPKTYPATQARSYMGDLLLTILLLLEKQPDYLLAIAVPDRTTFTVLLARLRKPLVSLGIGAYVVDVKGKATESWPPRSKRRSPDSQ